MPRYAYTSKEAPEVASTIPEGWDQNWEYPLPDLGPWADPDLPWPPGWPQDPIDPDNPGDEYDLTVTVPAAIHGGEAVVTANAFTQAPAPAAFLNNHTMRVTATLDGAPLGLKKTIGAGFAGELWYRMSNHDGVNYGISETMFFDVAFGDHGKTIAVTVSIVTVVPHITDSDSGVLDMNCPYVPWPGVAPVFTIQGYFDGMIGSCAGCLVSASPAWDGTFTPWFAFSCAWRDAGGVSMDGKGLQQGALDLVAGVWTIAIFCVSLPVALVVWSGTKDLGATPLGPYTRTSGCDLTPTITII